MKDYINGCYTKYGTRPLNIMEIVHKVQLSNGMWALIGNIPEDGISADVYKDEGTKEMVFMEHGIIASDNWKKNPSMIIGLVENRCKEMQI